MPRHPCVCALIPLFVLDGLAGKEYELSGVRDELVLKPEMKTMVKLPVLEEDVDHDEVGGEGEEKLLRWEEFCEVVEERMKQEAVEVEVEVEDEDEDEE
jgi:hypothetical protein